MDARTTKPVEETSAIVTGDAKAAFEFAKEELLERLKSKKWNDKRKALGARKVSFEEDAILAAQFFCSDSYTEAYIAVLEHSKTLPDLIYNTATLFEAFGEL